MMGGDWSGAWPAALATIAIIAAAGLIRHGWGRQERIAWAGWAIAVVALMVLAMLAGAWGLAVGTTAGMIALLCLLLCDGWRTPARAWRAIPPRSGSARDDRAVVRRIAVFVLVVPIGLAASLWLAFAVQAAAQAAGAGKANAYVAMIFLLPITWSILMSWQMMRGGPRAMIAPPAIAAAIGLLIWAAA